MFVWGSDLVSLYFYQMIHDPRHSGIIREWEMFRLPWVPAHARETTVFIIYYVIMLFFYWKCDIIGLCKEKAKGNKCNKNIYTILQNKHNN